MLCRGLIAADHTYWWSYSLYAATLRRLGKPARRWRRSTGASSTSPRSQSSLYDRSEETPSTAASRQSAQRGGLKGGSSWDSLGTMAQRVTDPGKVARDVVDAVLPKSVGRRRPISRAPSIDFQQAGPEGECSSFAQALRGPAARRCGRRSARPRAYGAVNRQLVDADYRRRAARRPRPGRSPTWRKLRVPAASDQAALDKTDVARAPASRPRRRTTSAGSRDQRRPTTSDDAAGRDQDHRPSRDLLKTSAGPAHRRTLEKTDRRGFHGDRPQRQDLPQEVARGSAGDAAHPGSA